MQLVDILGAVDVIGPAAAGDFRSRVSVFDELFWVFLILGTIVGIVVIGYTLYNGWRYRADNSDAELEDPPTVGELPTGQGGGKKLFVSFAISAVIVLGLIIYAYSALMYVEDGPSQDVSDQVEIDVTGIQFTWQFTYNENGETVFNDLVIPEDTPIRIEVTSGDVWHTFGIPDLRVKADAIPGDTATTWFSAEEQGTYLVECFELCGTGHSDMTANIHVVSQQEYEQYMDDLSDPNATAEIPA